MELLLENSRAFTLLQQLGQMLQEEKGLSERLTQPSEDLYVFDSKSELVCTVHVERTLSNLLAVKKIMFQKCKE